MPRPAITSVVRQNLYLALAYAGSGWLGLQLAIPPGYATAIFPAAGIGLAAVLLFGKQLLPGVFLGSTVMNLLISGVPLDAITFVRSSWIGAGATAQAGLGMWLITRRIETPSSLDRASDVLHILLVGGPLSCLLNPLSSVTALHLLEKVSADQYAQSVFTWWVGDSIGVLIFTPLTLLWFNQIRSPSPYNFGRARTVTIPVMVAFCMTIGVFYYASELIAANPAAEFSELGAWIILSIGLVFTGLMSAFLLIVTGQAQWVRREVDQRTQQLHQANQNLEEIIESQSKFLADVSHEIRNPLQVILGYVEILQVKDLATEHARIVDHISKSGENLNRVVGDLLDLGRIEIGQLQIKKDYFLLNQLGMHVQGNLRQFDTESSIQYSRHISERAKQQVFYGDEQRIYQIIHNLLRNAFQYTDSGMVQLDIDADGQQLCICVRDTGPGIKPEDIERIFESFERLPSTQNRCDGAGLGLTISQKLVNAMDGTLEVESDVGAGTVFRVAIPGALRPVDQPAPPADPNAAAAAHPATLSTVRILIAEDLPGNRGFLTELLRDLGYTHIKFAETGHDAVHACIEWRPDIILMDIRLPVLDGLEATRTIRSTELLPGYQPFIIGLSANAFPSDREACTNAGMDVFIAKPATKEQLEYVLRRSAVI